MSSTYKPKRKPKTLCPLERIYHLELALSDVRLELAKAVKATEEMRARLDSALKPAVLARPEWQTKMLIADYARSSKTHPLSY